MSIMRTKKPVIGMIICAAVLLLNACGQKGGVLIEDLPEVNFDIDSPVGQITKDVTVSQDFICRSGSISQLWLYGATYMRENTATVIVTLSTDEDTVAEWTIDSSGMEDNTIIKLDVPESAKNKGLRGKHCIIEISSPDGEPDLSPTFWMTQEDIYEDGHLTVGGYAQYNDLWFQIVS